jgi:ABC-type branched-subunit amino acid transport system substrate-binding protein
MKATWNTRSRVRAAVAAGASLALLLGISACGGGDGEDEPGPQRLDLVIGNVLPLSGLPAQLGESGKKASTLALYEIGWAANDLHADHSLRAIQRDQGEAADVATASARQLTDAGANCLTGPWSPTAVEQVANDVAIPGETPLIAPVPATTGVTELSDHDLINSTALPVSTEGRALADAIERSLGGTDGRTIGVAAADDSYGEELRQDFTEEWQDRDGTIGESPEAILVIGDPSDFAQLVSQSGYPWNPAIAWGSDRLVDPGLPGAAGSPVVTGMQALAPGTPDDGEPASEFSRAFDAFGPRGVEPEPYAAQEFDATVLCYLAAVAAGSTDGREMADELVDITAPGGEKFTWQQLPEAIKALEDGDDIDYDGASGPLDLDIHGNPTRGVFDLYRYTKRGLGVFGEVPVDKPNPATP